MKSIIVLIILILIALLGIWYIESKRIPPLEDLPEFPKGPLVPNIELRDTPNTVYPEYEGKG